jgi:hypothetical protein
MTVDYLIKHGAQNPWQILFDEIRDQMPVDSMAIANSEHPKTIDATKVLHTYKAILIWFSLRWYKALACFN